MICTGSWTFGNLRLKKIVSLICTGKVCYSEREGEIMMILAADVGPPEGKSLREPCRPILRLEEYF